MSRGITGKNLKNWPTGLAFLPIISHLTSSCRYQNYTFMLSLSYLYLTITEKKNKISKFVIQTFAIFSTFNEKRIKFRRLQFRHLPFSQHSTQIIYFGINDNDKAYCLGSLLSFPSQSILKASITYMCEIRFLNTPFIAGEIKSQNN